MDLNHTTGTTMGKWAGKYKDAHALILEKNSLAFFGPCATHSLNLCGVHAAQCCNEVITFFSIVQKTYTVFSSSPGRWEILQKHIDSSLHYFSERRSARIDDVKPLAAHLLSLVLVLKELLDNTNVEARNIC